MEAFGVVTKIIDEKTALVKTVRKSACAECHASGGKGCAACDIFLGKDSITAEAVNTVGAAVDDDVMIQTSSAEVIKAAAVVFLLPLLFAAAAYLIAFFVFHSEYAPLWSFAGLGVGCVGDYMYGRFRKVKETINIVKIIGKDMDINELE